MAETVFTDKDGVRTVEVDLIDDLPDDLTKPSTPVEKVTGAVVAENVFVGWADGQLTRSKRLVGDIHRRMDRWTSMDIGNSTSSWQGLNGGVVHVPVAKKAKQTLLKGVRQGLFPSESDWFDIDPVGPEDAGAARANKAYLDWQLGQVGFVQRFSDEALDMAATVGTVFVRTMFRQRVRNIRSERAEFAPVTDDLGNEMPGLFEEIRLIDRSRVDMGGVTDIRVVHHKSLFPFQTEGVDCLRDTPGFIETGVRDWAHIESRREKIHTVKNGDRFERRTIGIYQNVDRLNRSLARSLSSTGVEETQPNDAGASRQQESAMVTGHEWREIWFKQPIASIVLGQLGEGGKTVVSPQDFDAFRKKWRIPKADLEANGSWWVAEVIDGVLVRLVRNPAPFQEENEIPYLSFQWIRRAGNLYGISHYEQVEPLQRATDAVVSAGMDATMMNVRPMYAVKTGSFDMRNGPIQSQMAYQPDKAVEFATNANVNDAVQKLAPDQSTIQNALQAQEQYIRMIQDVSGATAELSGIASGGRKTATEIFQVTSGAMAGVAFLNVRIEQTLLTPMLRQFVDYNQNFAAPSQVVRVINERGVEEFYLIEANTLRSGRVDVMAKAASELTSRMVQGQTLTNIFAMFAPTNRMKISNWLKLIMNKMGVNEDPSLLVLTDEEFFQEQQLQAQAQNTESAELSQDGGPAQQIPVGAGPASMNQSGGGTLV